eukprot:TRINITY_DN15309_c0_g1_i1.p1 TRINITY_DN15309_c0_g1~~TRINITY_DN15309_c0_g1_i1.p1  ORF type:complete len:301 (-),score=45.08 TRINITY_DN15309_c0_g1_i1:156-1058(-)
MEVLSTSSKASEVAAPPSLVATSIPAEYHHKLVQAVREHQRLSQLFLLEVSSTASNRSAADICSLDDCYGSTSLVFGESEILNASGLAETVSPAVGGEWFVGIGVSPGVCAKPLMALAQCPFVPKSEDSFTTQRRPTVDASDEGLAPIAFTSQQKKPLKLFCGWCGAKRMRAGIPQTFCGNCGNALDGVDKKGQEASMRSTVYPDMPADHWTPVSGGDAPAVLRTVPTRPTLPPGYWSSTNQAAAQVHTGEHFWPMTVLTPVEQQTSSLRKAVTSSLVREGFYHHPGTVQRDYTVLGIRL